MANKKKSLLSILVVTLIVFMVSSAALYLKKQPEDIIDEPVAKDYEGSDVQFLKDYGYFIKETIGNYAITIPENWNVSYGDYPEGLYWSVANVLSKDIGLDLNKLKGKKVDATVYDLGDVLKDQDQFSTFIRPANAVVLRESGKIKGAWLMYNTMVIGPSLDQHYLEDITGKTFNDWVWDEGVIFLQTSYLPSPDATLRIFFEAINSGDKKIANTCLSPSYMLQSLTMNQDFSKGLYQDGFKIDNSLVENIVSATDIGIVSYFDNKTMQPIEDREAFYDAMPIGTHIEIELLLNLVWQDDMFNSEGKQTRFAVLEKTRYGWKFEGLGTGR